MTSFNFISFADYFPNQCGDSKGDWFGGSCKRSNDSTNVVQYRGSYNPPTPPQSIASKENVTQIPIKIPNSNSPYAACSPNANRFENLRSTCGGSSCNTCDLKAPGSALAFSDCPNTLSGGNRSNYKPIKYNWNTVTKVIDGVPYTFHGAANCDMNYMVNSDNVSNVVKSKTNSSDKSCSSIPNFFGQTLNTVTTLGISLAMLDSFSSNVVAHCNGCHNGQASLLEGEFLDLDTMLANTSICPAGVSKDVCMQTFMKGFKIELGANGHTASFCLKNPKSCQVPLAESDIAYTRDVCKSYPNIDRPAKSDSGQYLKDDNGQTLFCPLTRCNMPTNDIRFNYDDARFYLFDGAVGINDSGTVAVGQTRGTGFGRIGGSGGAVSLKGETSGSKVCINMLFTLGYSPISCKPRVMQLMNWPVNSSECISPACRISQPKNLPQTTNNWQSPAAFNSFTGTMVQCFTETIKILMQGVPGTTCKGALPKFQYNMRSIVKTALLLYVIIYGISIAIKGELPQKAELAIFIAKIAFVLWAGVGTFSDPENVSAQCVGAGNKWCPTNGLEFLYNSIMSMMESFPSMLMKAVCNPEAGENCICTYPSEMYQEGFSYLSLWDSLDCRISYYLGISSPTQSGVAMLSAASVGVAAFAGPFALIIALLFAFEILIILLMICFAVFLISFTVFLVNIYLLCTLSLAILVYLGPIFIPMILFKNTKSMFDSWFTLLIGYALQPTVVMAFISVMIVLFDNIIYADCLFEKVTVSNVWNYWKIKCLVSGESCQCSPTCKGSVGYIFAQLGPGGSMYDIPWPLDDFILFAKPGLFLDTYSALATALWQATIFAFIFYYFSKQLAAFAGDLTQTASLGSSAISPTAVIDKAGYAVKIAAKAAWAAVTQDASGLKKEMKREAIKNAKTVTKDVQKAKGTMDDSTPTGSGSGSGMKGQSKRKGTSSIPSGAAAISATSTKSTK